MPTDSNDPKDPRASKDAGDTQPNEPAPPEFMEQASGDDEEQPWEPVTLVPVLAQEAVGSVFQGLGSATRNGFSYLGGVARLSWGFARVFWRPPWGVGELIAQAEAIGVKSLPIALLILFFVGLVFALQFGLTLQTMGATPYVGRVTSLSIVRELGPVFTALVVGGRVGAGMAAEIGSMKVTEQVDAIRALGADPIKKLVVPRILATTFMLPLLALFADIVGVVGGMIIANAQFDISMVHFAKNAVNVVRVTDLISGYLKPFFFGFGIAAIGCYEGLNCGQGTEGVGRATTRAVVNVSIMVVVVDFLLSKLFTLLPRI